MKALPARLYLILIILVISSVCFAQEKVSPKALKYFEKARDYYQSGSWQECESELQKVIQTDSLFTDAYIMLGDIKMDAGKPGDAIMYYKKALSLNPGRPRVLLAVIANTLFSQEDYTEAIPYYEQLMAAPQADPEENASNEKKLSDARFRQFLMQNPVAYDPVNLGQDVNSSEDEYINAIAADGSGIFFTRRSKNRNGQGREFNEDFYFAAFRDDTLTLAEKLNYPPGKDNDAGGLCISPDGRLLFFTACNRADSYGSCDLYFSEKKGGKWSVVQNMGQVVNSESWDAQPSISPDGKTLYFASSRKGGFGSSDIWKTERMPGGGWGKPVNLGLPLNSSSAEMAPFIHFDNQTLYYSSSGHQGMGGADLFKSTREGNHWNVPQNLGYPLNSAADELVIIVNPGGDMGYISCNLKNSVKGYDIFSFRLAENIKPNPVTYLKGKVYDRDRNTPLGAKFSLIDLALDSVIIESVSDKENGEFLVCLPGKRDYALNVSCEGYLFYSDHFPLSEIKTQLDPVLKNIPMEPVRVGNSMILRNVFFDTDKYELKKESIPELQKLVDFLDDNPGLRIEIGGHTDNEGPEDHNAALSLDRAKSVFEYLISAGIAAKRMTYKGFGESNPVVPNDSEENKAQNRRTEITIVL